MTGRCPWLALAMASLALCAPAAGAPAVSATDRLERFRALAAGDLAVAQLDGGDAVDRVVSELYALVDEEIIDSLDSGGPFASPEFIQDRLDGFGGAWGGAVFRAFRPAVGPGRPSLTVAVLSLSGVAGSGSMRVYGRGPSGILPLRTATHDGLPEAHAWPPARDGAPQWLMSWTGVASGSGVRPLRLELWRQRSAGDAARVWSSAELFPDGLWASAVSIRRAEISVRYELRYPGWKPGCEGQTEQEDTYRVAGDVPALARRQVVNAWHRDLGTAVDRLFSALEHRDARRLSELVPDPRLRSRLPVGLRPEPACEAQNPDTPGIVVVAATDEGSGGAGRGGGGPARSPSPWSLWWTRAAGGAWRLSAAEPVLQ